MRTQLRFLFLFVLLLTLTACPESRRHSSYAENHAHRYPIDEARRDTDTIGNYYAIKFSDVRELLEVPAPCQDKPELILVRKAYIVSYNKDTRNPNWVAWHLSANHAAQRPKMRNPSFCEDEDVSKPRAQDYDYCNSGWTRGHMCPRADTKWDKLAYDETFILSNICPQHEKLNTGDWNEIEMSCRKWARRFGDIYIVCGPIYLNREHETIGHNKVVVPEAFFKVVMCLNGTPKGIGFICRNTEGNRKKDHYVNSISEIERVTGYKFFPLLDSTTSRLVKDSCDIALWDGY